MLEMMFMLGLVAVTAVMSALVQFRRDVYRRMPTLPR